MAVTLNGKPAYFLAVHVSCSKHSHAFYAGPNTVSYGAWRGDETCHQTGGIDDRYSPAAPP